jgi:4'-phosphopantetheinyl transferase EntD
MGDAGKQLWICEGAGDVVVLAGRQREWEEEGLEAERELVEGGAEFRRREFLAARGLAHEGMRRFGVEEKAILRKGRAPVWPEGVVGALSHASGRGGQEGWAAAAVGRAGEVRGIGIDLEWVGRVGERLWERVFNERERAVLDALPEGVWRELSAGIGFSAKEAFFKLFHPLTGRWAEFHDATVVAQDDGRFVLECAAELPGIPGRLEGWWAQPMPELVLCWLVLGA